MSPGFAAAKRFLHSWRAGDVAMAAVVKELEAQAEEDPAVAEVVRRAFADVDADDFENIIAHVYARHISAEHLRALADFTESPAGGRFFRLAIGSALAGERLDPEEAMRRFNADEIEAIIGFVKSDAFKAMSAALPTINRELEVEGERFGERVVQDYLDRRQ